MALGKEGRKTLPAKVEKGDLWWIARSPGVDGPYGQGASPEAAIQRLQEAIEFWLDLLSGANSVGLRDDTTQPS